jgi:hypothetical protein
MPATSVGSTNTSRTRMTRRRFQNGSTLAA